MWEPGIIIMHTSGSPMSNFFFERIFFIFQGIGENDKYFFAFDRL